MTDLEISQAVEYYSDTVYKIAYNITHNKEDSFDVCQEVFLKLVKNHHKLNDETHLKAWLIRTAVNCAKSNCTQAYKKHRSDLEEIKELTYTDQGDSIADMVAQLPERYRTPLHLFYYNDMSVEDIAKILKITKPGVRSRLSRGRKLLKEIMEKENYYG